MQASLTSTFFEGGVRFRNEKNCQWEIGALGLLDNLTVSVPIYERISPLLS
jgi:hypothetical protein